MKLHPDTSTSTPAYPARKLLSRARRALVRGSVGAACAALLTLSACAGEPGTRREPAVPAASAIPHQVDSTGKQSLRGQHQLTQCQPAVRLSGLMAPTQLLRCEAPTGRIVQFPLALAAGQTCAGQSTAVQIVVSAPTHARFSFNRTPSNTRLTLLAPDGRAVVQLTPQNPCVELDVEPGSWTIVASPLTAAGNQSEHFEFSFTQ